MIKTFFDQFQVDFFILRKFHCNTCIFKAFKVQIGSKYTLVQIGLSNVPRVISKTFLEYNQVDHAQEIRRAMTGSPGKTINLATEQQHRIIF